MLRKCTVTHRTLPIPLSSAPPRSMPAGLIGVLNTMIAGRGTVGSHHRSPADTEYDRRT